MKGWAFLLLVGLITLFVSTGSVYAQTTAYIPSDRSISWQPGIPGGIPDGYPNYNTTNSASSYYWPICATINAGDYGNGTIDASTAINTALSNCPDHEIVQLSAGTFMVANTLDLYNRSSTDYNGVVLRGAGFASTKIFYTGSSGIFRLGSQYSNGFPQQYTGSINAGFNQLTVSGLEYLTAGQAITIPNGISLGVPFTATINAISSVVFTVSGVTTAPTVGAVYTNNMATFTVVSASLSGDPGTLSGTITCSLPAGSRSPYQNTLTKTSGTGDASITFSSYTAVLTLSANIPSTITNGPVDYSLSSGYSLITFSGSDTVIPKGSTSINVASTAGIAVGSYLLITQNNPSIVSVYPYSDNNLTTTVTVNNSNSNQITVASTSGYSVGDYLTVQNGTFNGVNLTAPITAISGNTFTLSAPTTNNVEVGSIVYNAGYCSYCGDNRPGTAMGQFVQVTAINGNTVTLNRPLYDDLDQDLFPTVLVENMAQGSGIEDLYFHPTKGNDAPNILMDLCANCWVADVESDTAGAGNGSPHVQMSDSYASVVRDSYLHDAYAHESGSGYGVWIFGLNSDHLIENNIFRRTRHSMIFEGGGSGVVFAYNYSINNIEALGADNYSTWDDNAMSPDAVTHGAFPYMNLYEGNVSAQLSFDNAHGNSAYNTAFRNYFTGATTYPTGTPGTASAWVTWGLNPVNDTWQNDDENVADNVLGIPNCPSTSDYYESDAPAAALPSVGQDYLIYALGYYDGGYAIPPILDSDLEANSNLPGAMLRYDNYNCINAAVPAAEKSGETIPASLYYSSKPGWWGNLPWPAIGSDLTPNVGMIPAEQRYLAIQAAGTVHMFPGDLTGDENPPGVPLTVSSPLLGDVNGDGQVTIYDAELTAQYAVGLPVSNFNVAAAEVDGNSTVDIYDAYLIAKYAVGLITKFPVQQ